MGVTAVSARELFRRTLRADGADRGHRPDANLRRTTPAQCARPVCGALQPEATASIAAATSAVPGRACPRADPRQDPASADPRRLDQRVRGRGLKPRVRCRGEFWPPTGPLRVDTHIPSRHGRSLRRLVLGGLVARVFVSDASEDAALADEVHRWLVAVWGSRKSHTGADQRRSAATDGRA